MICTFDSITNKCILKEIKEFPSTEIIENEIISESFSDFEINSDESTEDELYSEDTYQYLSQNEISEQTIISDEQIICFYDYKINKCEQFLCDRMEDESVICDKINDVNTNIKCVYDEYQNICKKEEKLCYEFDNGATEDICLNAKVSNESKICAFDNETNICNEVDKIIEEDHGCFNPKYNNLFLWLLYLLLFI